MTITISTVEIPHTKCWRALVSSVSSCLSDSTLSRYIKNALGNAHHLSEGAVTDIMEAFGEAIQNNLKTRLAGVPEYAVMADECTDVNAHAVVIVCVRFIEYRICRSTLYSLGPKFGSGLSQQMLMLTVFDELRNCIHSNVIIIDSLMNCVYLFYY